MVAVGASCVDQRQNRLQTHAHSLKRRVCAYQQAVQHQMRVECAHPDGRARENSLPGGLWMPTSPGQPSGRWCSASNQDTTANAKIENHLGGTLNSEKQTHTM